MAHTRHQTVTRVAPKSKGSSAKISNLKQAAHQGKAPVKDARNAQSGYTVVPASVATLPPGEGPPMSSTPSPAGRGSSKRNASRKNSTSAGPASNSSAPSQAGSAQVTQPVAAVVVPKRGGAGRRTSAKHRSRKAKKG